MTQEHLHPYASKFPFYQTLNILQSLFESCHNSQLNTLYQPLPLKFQNFKNYPFRRLESVSPIEAFVVIKEGKISPRALTQNNPKQITNPVNIVLSCPSFSKLIKAYSCSEDVVAHPEIGKPLIKIVCAQLCV